jgi:hypothetical protein
VFGNLGDLAVDRSEYALPPISANRESVPIAKHGSETVIGQKA